MQVDHRNYDIPHKIGPVKIHPLTWQDFKASPPNNSPFLAHIYWTVSYEFESVSQRQPTVKVNVSVRPKSWKIVEELALLKHQYGHYLIGCLCGLSFAKKVNFDFTWNPRINFGIWCRQLLNQCLKQYCEMQKLYDQQTEHYLNQHMQESWQDKIKEQLLEFDSFFRGKSRQEMRRGDKKLTQVNQNNLINNLDQKKARSNNGANKKFSIRKEMNSQTNKNRGKQLMSSKKNVQNKNQLQPMNEIYTSKGTVLAQIRHYKKLQDTDNAVTNKHQSLPNKASFALRPLTTLLKPL